MENKESSHLRITANADSLILTVATGDSANGETNGSSNLRISENSDLLTAATGNSVNAEKNGSSDLRITENNDPLTNAATKIVGEAVTREDSVATGDSANRSNSGPDLTSPGLATEQPDGCGKMSSTKRLSVCTMQENCSQVTKTSTGPTGVMANNVKKQQQVLPFRERNIEEGKRSLPPYIKVPPKNIFGYPERYRSPTDAMVSPVSRGLLTRNRRPARTLAPAVPPKALENTFQNVVLQAGPDDSDQIG